MAGPVRFDEIESPEFFDTFFAVLTSSTRRYALGELVTSGEPVTVEQLVERVAPREATVPFGSSAEDLWIEVETTFRHVHLPLLTDTGLVVWNRDLDTVELTPVLEQLWSVVPDLEGALELPSRS